MTPARAARHVAEKYRSDYRLADSDEDARLSYALWQAFKGFAELLDPPTSQGGNP